MLRMRVCLFTDADVFAGTERHMLDLAGGLRDLGLAVEVACPKPSPLAAGAEAAGLTVRAVAKQGMLDREAIQNLAQSLREGRIDLLHAHNGRTALIAALAVRMAGKGICVTTQHFLEPSHATRHGLQALPGQLAHRWVNSKLLHCIAISEAVKQSILDRQELPSSKITVVPNGLSCDPVPSEKAAALRAEFGIAEDAPLLVCVARLEREKDVVGLLTAFREARERVPEARALVVGEGSQRQSLEAAAETLGIAEAVQFTGFREDARTAIAAADVFVLPSPAEPFGLVLLEAMALGKAVVAIDAGGPREIVVTGETGLLVPPSDPAALAEALCRLLSSPEERQRMGDAGRQRYEECFTTTQMAQRTQAVYAQAMGA